MQMDKRIVKLNELIELSRRRFHKKKEAFYLKIKEYLVNEQESHAVTYLETMQNAYKTRADVEAYEMKEAFKQVRALLK